MTNAEKIIAKLIETGWKEDRQLTHYRVFSKDRHKSKYFVGRNGALRKGYKVSSAQSVGDHTNIDKTIEYIVIRHGVSNG